MAKRKELSFTTYTDGVIARSHNKRIVVKKNSNTEGHVLEFYSMHEKGTTPAKDKIAHQKIKRGRSELLFRLTDEGLEMLITAGVKYLKKIHANTITFTKP